MRASIENFEENFFGMDHENLFAILRLHILMNIERFHPLSFHREKS